MIRPARFLGLVLIAGCAARHPAPPLAGPSSAPVMETPARVALIAAPGNADWKALGDEATALLSQYIRINTTNPPGNEIMAARWLADVLRRDGIEARVFEPAPGKANLYARLAGDGSARPVIPRPVHDRARLDVARLARRHPFRSEGFQRRADDHGRSHV